MSIDWLEDLERAIEFGEEYYACPGMQGSEWYISKQAAELSKRAQRVADTKKFPVSVYRMVSRANTVSGDSFLVVRKILDPGPRGEPNLQWALVDTREAAEMLRDVSQGPSPYFGASVEETVNPSAGRGSTL
jgi:hypothetical protein